ncbi:hypothetical protein [Anaerovorax odorimutans]|uniref:hypothetical protein n=1 Tax=Anaerovorax odorimutans TaxID=109327 RepID=UPI0003FABE25|nr:hypothetical protein [Anaerovorax odorimutans]
MRLKKTIVFILVFMSVLSVVTVDSAYSDMLDQEGKLIPNVKRLNTNYLSISMFGKSEEINIKELEENWNKISTIVVSNLDSFVTNVRKTFGIEKEEINYDAFKPQLL